MATCGELITFLEQRAPIALAEEWDNVGLLVGSRDKQIKTVLLCLDVTADTVEYAADKGVDMIISHHPVIFKELKKLTDEDAKGRLLGALICSGICVYCAHTNLDYATEGVNTQLAKALGLSGTAIMGEGPGLYGRLERVMRFDDFLDFVKRSLNTPHVRAAGKPGPIISSAAVYCGSFDDDLEAFGATGADILVTGDLKYHTAMDAREAGLCIIDAGHFCTERVVLPFLAGLLKESFADVGVMLYEQEQDPLITY